jgi:hypothetical protein
MSTKESILQEIGSMSEQQLTEALSLIRSIKDKQIAGVSINQPQPKPTHRKGSGKSILRHAGRWVGDDLKQCLEIVQSSRGLAEF